MSTQQQNAKQAGFTLVELMIVVVVIGILAAVAIPTFTKFIRRSKFSEVPPSFKAMKIGALDWYSEIRNSGSGLMARHFPSASSPTGIASGAYKMPAAGPCANGVSKYKVNSTQWEVQPWSGLKFGLKDPHYYQYHYIVNNSRSGSNPSFTLRAVGDLDCDKVLSTYQMIGTKSVGSEVTVGGITKTRDLE